MTKGLLIALIALIAAHSGIAAERSGKPALKKTPPGNETKKFEAVVLPLLRNYCFDCHGDGAKKGDVTLDAFTNSASVHQDPKIWERVLHNLQTSSMPPPKRKTQPTPAERERLVQWIQTEVFPVDCEHPDPGRVTIRRLNRAEYRNTIRDLVGVDFRRTEDFPQDDVGYGFDNIGDVLSMPPVLLEKYLVAAEQILDEAIVTEDLLQRRTRQFGWEDLEANTVIDPRNEGWFGVMREGDVYTQVRILAAGDYILRVRAAGEQAGTEPVRMSLRLDDQNLLVAQVPESRRDSKVREARFRLERGSHKIAARYLNNFVDPKASDPKRRDRNLLLQSLELEGPLQPVPQPLPESHLRIFFRPVDASNPQPGARKIIEGFAHRAWRRPLEVAELDRLLALFDLARKQGESIEKSVKIALQAILVSPHFLFRGELQNEPDNPARVQPVSELALASRLSFFLWSSMPDAELFKLAESGRLRRNLGAQLRRMLQDPKSRALVDNFAGQWLQIQNLDLVNPDQKRFPAFTEALRRDLGQETQLFIEGIIRENRSVLEVLDADYSFLNERLAKLYGIEGVEGEQFRKVVFQDRRRGGLLSQGSILTITSNPTRTSPVKRGKWVLENLLGSPPPPPPPNVPDLKEDKEHALTGTLRQRMEQHRANPMCASCHEKMDPIGFGFENFDAIGAWRTSDGGADIDASGKLVTGETFNGPADLKRIMLEQHRGEFLRCLTEKLLTYALGRGLDYYDRCAVDKIIANLEPNGFRFLSLVQGVVDSAPFQLRRGEGRRDLQAKR